VIGTKVKAETIAGRTAKHISKEWMKIRFFIKKKLSELIQQTISDLRAMRDFLDVVALNRLKALREQAITKKNRMIFLKLF
jgi:hypothetical protein